MESQYNFWKYIDLIAEKTINKEDTDDENEKKRNERGGQRR